MPYEFLVWKNQQPWPCWLYYINLPRLLTFSNICTHTHTHTHTHTRTMWRHMQIHTDNIILSSWKMKAEGLKSSTFSHCMAHTRDKTALNSKCKPWFTNSCLHYSQARISTSWWETVAHHDPTSLISRRTQHATNIKWTMTGENVLYMVYSANYIYNMHIHLSPCGRWNLEWSPGCVQTALQP